MEDKNKMNSNDLNDVSGGRLHPHPSGKKQPDDVYCGGYNKYQKHQFEFIPNTVNPSEYYGISRCVLGGYEKKVYENPSPLQ